MFLDALRSNIELTVPLNITYEEIWKGNLASIIKLFKNLYYNQCSNFPNYTIEYKPYLEIQNILRLIFHLYDLEYKTSKDLSDARYFCALIHYLNPSLLDYNETIKINQELDHEKLITNAFEIFEKEFNLPILLDAIDVINYFDKYSMDVYLSYLNKYALPTVDKIIQKIERLDEIKTLYFKEYRYYYSELMFDNLTVDEFMFAIGYQDVETENYFKKYQNGSYLEKKNYLECVNSKMKPHFGNILEYMIKYHHLEDTYFLFE